MVMRSRLQTASYPPIIFDIPKPISQYLLTFAQNSSLVLTGYFIANGFKMLDVLL